MPVKILFSQISCVCHDLLQRKQIDRLTEFIDSVPKHLLYGSDENILKARSLVAFKRQRFQELYRLLESHTFHSSNHKVGIKF